MAMEPAVKNALYRKYVIRRAFFSFLRDDYLDEDLTEGLSLCVHVQHVPDLERRAFA